MHFSAPSAGSLTGEGDERTLGLVELEDPTALEEHVHLVHRRDWTSSATVQQARERTRLHRELLKSRLQFLVVPLHLHSRGHLSSRAADLGAGQRLETSELRGVEFGHGGSRSEEIPLSPSTTLRC